MFFALFLLIVFGCIEFSVLIEMGEHIGAANTVSLCLLSGGIGVYFARKEGLAILLKMQKTLAQQILPACEIVDGFFIFAAGVFLIAPGFISDLAGFLLLIPFIRINLRNWLLPKIEACYVQRLVTRVDYSQSQHTPKSFTHEEAKIIDMDKS